MLTDSEIEYAIQLEYEIRFQTGETIILWIPAPTPAQAKLRLIECGFPVIIQVQRHISA